MSTDTAVVNSRKRLRSETNPNEFADIFGQSVGGPILGGEDRYSQDDESEEIFGIPGPKATVATIATNSNKLSAIGNGNSTDIRISKLVTALERHKSKLRLALATSANPLIDDYKSYINEETERISEIEQEISDLENRVEEKESQEPSPSLDIILSSDSILSVLKTPSSIDRLKEDQENEGDLQFANSAIGDEDEGEDISSSPTSDLDPDSDLTLNKALSFGTTLNQGLFTPIASSSALEGNVYLSTLDISNPEGAEGGEAPYSEVVIGGEAPYSYVNCVNAPNCTQRFLVQERGALRSHEVFCPFGSHQLNDRGELIQSFGVVTEGDQDLVLEPEDQKEAEAEAKAEATITEAEMDAEMDAEMATAFAQQQQQQQSSQLGGGKVKFEIKKRPVPIDDEGVGGEAIHLSFKRDILIVNDVKVPPAIYKSSINQVRGAPLLYSARTKKTGSGSGSGPESPIIRVVVAYSLNSRTGFAKRRAFVPLSDILALYNIYNDQINYDLVNKLTNKDIVFIEDQEGVQETPHLTYTGLQYVLTEPYATRGRVEGERPSVTGWIQENIIDMLSGALAPKPGSVVRWSSSAIVVSEVEAAPVPSNATTRFQRKPKHLWRLKIWAEYGIDNPRPFSIITNVENGRSYLRIHDIFNVIFMGGETTSIIRKIVRILGKENIINTKLPGTNSIHHFVSAFGAWCLMKMLLVKNTEQMNILGWLTEFIIPRLEIGFPIVVDKRDTKDFPDRMKSINNIGYIQLGGGVASSDLGKESASKAVQRGTITASSSSSSPPSSETKQGTGKSTLKVPTLERGGRSTLSRRVVPRNTTDWNTIEYTISKLELRVNPVHTRVSGVRTVTIVKQFAVDNIQTSRNLVNLMDLLHLYESSISNGLFKSYVRRLTGEYSFQDNVVKLDGYEPSDASSFLTDNGFELFLSSPMSEADPKLTLALRDQITPILSRIKKLSSVFMAKTSQQPSDIVVVERSNVNELLHAPTAVPIGSSSLSVDTSLARDLAKLQERVQIADRQAADAAAVDVNITSSSSNGRSAVAPPSSSTLPKSSKSKKTRSDESSFVLMIKPRSDDIANIARAGDRKVNVIVRLNVSTKHDIARVLGHILQKWPGLDRSKLNLAIGDTISPLAPSTSDQLKNTRWSLARNGSTTVQSAFGYLSSPGIPIHLTYGY